MPGKRFKKGKYKTGRNGESNIEYPKEKDATKRRILTKIARLRKSRMKKGK